MRTPHCGQLRRHPSLVRTNELYESTQHPHRRNTQPGNAAPLLIRAQPPTHGEAVAPWHVADSALRTPTPAPIIGPHPRIVRIDDVACPDPAWVNAAPLLIRAQPVPGRCGLGASFGGRRPPCGLRIADINGPTNNGSSPPTQVKASGAEGSQLRQWPVVGGPEVSGLSAQGVGEL